MNKGIEERKKKDLEHPENIQKESIVQDSLKKKAEIYKKLSNQFSY